MDLETVLKTEDDIHLYSGFRWLYWDGTLWVVKQSAHRLGGAKTLYSGSSLPIAFDYLVNEQVGEVSE